MFRSVGWKMATIGPVPWETSGAGHRYITYILWLLFMWPSYLCYWPSESSHTFWLICCPPTYAILFPVLATCGFLLSGGTTHFLFVLWLYTGGLSSWNLLLFLCSCKHRHFKIISLQFHEIFPFLATRTVLLWFIVIKFFLIFLIKIEAVGCEPCSTIVLWFEIHWLKVILFHQIQRRTIMQE